MYRLKWVVVCAGFVLTCKDYGECLMHIIPPPPTAFLNSGDQLANSNFALMGHRESAMANRDDQRMVDRHFLMTVAMDRHCLRSCL